MHPVASKRYVKWKSVQNHTMFMQFLGFQFFLSYCTEHKTQRPCWCVRRGIFCQFFKSTNCIIFSLHIKNIFFVLLFHNNYCHNWLRLLCNFKSVPAVALEGLNIFMELEIAGVVFKDNPPEKICFLSHVCREYDFF